MISRLFKKLSNKGSSGLIAKQPVYLVSFPKSGRSWLRLMMCYSVYNDYPLPEGEDPTKYLTERLHEQHDKIPPVVITHDDNPEYKTVEELDRLKEQYKDSKVILLVRDPRDVMISQYFHIKHRGVADNQELMGEVSKPGEMITRDRGGMKTLIEFYNIWAEKKNITDQFLLVRYEDLRNETSKYVRTIFDFMGCGDIISEAAIEAAVAATEFDKVKEAEAANKIKHIAFETTNTENPDAFKARRGVVGGYKDYLNEEEMALAAELISARLNSAYGY